MDSDLTACLARLEAELHHPGSTASRERLDALLHPDFREVGRSGRPYERETVLDFLARRTSIPAVVNDGHRVEPLADGCVLLTYRSAEIGPDGARRHEALRMSVWVHDGAAWRLRYHQGTAVG